MKTRIFGLAVALASLAPITHAAPLTIVNYDFETGGFATESQSSGSVPTGWTAVNGSISGTAYGYWNAYESHYVGTAGNVAIANMSGPNVFYFGSAANGQGIEQTLTATFATDTDYSLTVALGSRLNYSSQTGSLDVRLLAGRTLIASGTFRNTAFDGTFADFSLNYTASAGDSAREGEALTIQFLENSTDTNSNPSQDVDIDNIRLTATTSAIPEPSTYAAIFGALALGTAAFRRRQARA